MTQLLNDFLSGSAAWGVLLTLAAFALGTLINKVTGKAIFNPLLLGSIFVIIFLSVCNIPYADYKASAAPVNYLLLPATVALAIPLYEKIDLLKENAAAIIAGISVGTLVSLGSALALALALPGHGSAETEDCGAAPDGSAVYKSFSASAAPEALSATLVLPEGAELAPGEIQPTSRTDEPFADVPESAACTIVLGGHDYDYSAVYADAPMPAPDGNLPEVTWQVGGLTLLLYADGAVGWYDAAAGIQWYCVAWDGGQPLVTAFALMDAQSYTVPTAPEGAAVQGYDLFDLDGETVTQVRFTLNGITWQYRMAPTDDVSETIPDISEFTGGSLTAESTVRWCTALLRWDEGGAGCIIWRDMAPGLVYSLTTDSGASEDALSDMAALVFQPAQDES